MMDLRKGRQYLGVYCGDNGLKRVLSLIHKYKINKLDNSGWFGGIGWTGIEDG